MASIDIPTPGLVWGPYPQRRQAGRRGRAARLAHAIWDLGRGAVGSAADDAEAFISRVQEELARLDGTPIGPAQAQTLRLHFAREGLSTAAVAQGIALVSLAAKRTLGQAAFETQWLAARAVLDNCLAEMATGEGKTLAIALAAATAALAGMPVHVLTANDYLVARDAERLAPLYDALGLTVGCVVGTDEPEARRRAYACDITYATAKELAFDYLRDGLDAPATRGAIAEPLAKFVGTPGAEPQRLLRGLCMAIVDEADAILIDEAGVPLILSQPVDTSESNAHASRALRLARAMRPVDDFVLDGVTMSARLTDRGRARLAAAVQGRASAASSSLDLAWRHSAFREHSVSTALGALHLYQRDRHYLVRDGRVTIIDPTTGRTAEGRVWAEGLQQLVELKEGCACTPSLATVVQITYQRFFPRYLRLGGLSGTLGDARAELRACYGLEVRRVPLRQPSRRIERAARLVRDHETLWAQVAARVIELHVRGVPVLVATDSVAETHAVALILARRGIPVALLSARDDRDEAEVVSRAGQRGAVTVSTNMAGRGTDIALGEGVAELGGLHVLCCQLNAALRIDRQLHGRAARQGDPGVVETWLSLDTMLVARFWPGLLRRALRPLAHRLPAAFVYALARVPQIVEERRTRQERERLIELDQRTESELAFGGRFE